MLSYYLVAIGVVMLTAISQILMKMGARSVSRISWRVYFNGYTLTAYASLLLVTLMNLYVFRQLPLKVMLVLLPSVLLLVMLLSYWLLHERLSRRQIAGALVVMVGLVVFNL